MAADNGGRSCFFSGCFHLHLPFMMEFYRREFLFEQFFSFFSVFCNKFISPNVFFVLFYCERERTEFKCRLAVEVKRGRIQRNMMPLELRLRRVLASYVMQSVALKCIYSVDLHIDSHTSSWLIPNSGIIFKARKPFIRYIIMFADNNAALALQAEEEKKEKKKNDSFFDYSQRTRFAVVEMATNQNNNHVGSLQTYMQKKKYKKNGIRSICARHSKLNLFSFRQNISCVKK